MKFLFKSKSQIHGRGIFTAKDISAHETFYKIPLEHILHEPKKGCAFIGNNTWVSDEEVLNYVNHSCNPNSVLELSEIPRLVASRKISIGEEISVDYGLTENSGTNVPCNCRSSNCRGYFSIKK